MISIKKIINSNKLLFSISFSVLGLGLLASCTPDKNTVMESEKHSNSAPNTNLDNKTILLTLEGEDKVEWNSQYYTIEELVVSIKKRDLDLRNYTAIVYFKDPKLTGKAHHIVDVFDGLGVKLSATAFSR